jgi:hypothetical protein
MLKPIKMLVFLSILSWAFTNGVAIAQSTTSSLEEEDITFSGESLQGIEMESSDVNENYQTTPKLDLTIETEKESSGDDSPIYTIDKINTNQGEGSDSQGGTIPLTSF